MSLFAGIAYSTPNRSAIDNPAFQLRVKPPGLVCLLICRPDPGYFSANSRRSVSYRGGQFLDASSTTIAKPIGVVSKKVSKEERVYSTSLPALCVGQINAIDGSGMAYYSKKNFTAAAAAAIAPTNSVSHLNMDALALIVSALAARLRSGPLPASGRLGFPDPAACFRSRRRLNSITVLPSVVASACRHLAA